MTVPVFIVFFFIRSSGMSELLRGEVDATKASSGESQRMIENEVRMYKVKSLCFRIHIHYSYTMQDWVGSSN